MCKFNRPESTEEAPQHYNAFQPQVHAHWIRLFQRTKDKGRLSSCNQCQLIHFPPFRQRQTGPIQAPLFFLNQYEGHSSAADLAIHLITLRSSVAPLILRVVKVKDRNEAIRTLLTEAAAQAAKKAPKKDLSFDSVC